MSALEPEPPGKRAGSLLPVVYGTARLPGVSLCDLDANVWIGLRVTSVGGSAFGVFTHLITAPQVWVSVGANAGLRKRRFWASVRHPDRFSIAQNQNKQTGV